MTIGEKLSEDWTHREIAEFYEKSPGWVSERVAELRDELLTAVSEQTST